MKKLLFLCLFIPSLVAADPRFPFPKTPDEVWQNDLDLRDLIDRKLGTSSVGSGDCIDEPTFCVDSANSRVGIGTAAPSSLLHVVSSDAVNVRGTFENTHSTGNAGIVLANDTNSFQMSMFGTDYTGTKFGLNLADRVLLRNGSGTDGIIIEAGGGNIVAGISDTAYMTMVSSGAMEFNGDVNIADGLFVDGNAKVSGLTSSRIVSASAADFLTSVDLINWSTGTANQVTAIDDGDGTITYITPQDISTTSAVIFGSAQIRDSSGGTNLTIRNDAADGDPALIFNLGASLAGRIKIDDGDSDKFIFSTSVDDTWIMTQDGEITRPLQPSFLAHVGSHSADVTGDGTNITVEFDSERFDLGGNFNTGTYTFTAPVTGKYRLSVGINCVIDATHEFILLQLITSNEEYRRYTHVNATPIVWGSNTVTVECDMDASDTALVKLQVGTGNKNVEPSDTSTVAWNYFSGSLQN